MGFDDLVKKLESLKLYRQSRVVRWQLRDFVFPENDSEHQLFVTQIILCLSAELNIDDETTLAAIKYGCVHDYVESCSGVGDVNYAVKEQLPNLKQLVKKLELDAMKTVPCFYAAMEDCLNNELAKLLVDFADSLEAHLYVRREIRHNKAADEWLELVVETEKRCAALYEKICLKLE